MMKANNSDTQDQPSAQTSGCLRAGGVSVCGSEYSLNAVNVPRTGEAARVCLLRDEIKPGPTTAGIRDAQTPDERGEAGIWLRPHF